VIRYAEMATATLPIGKVCELLGGPHVLGKELRSQLEVVPLLRVGLPYRSLEVLSCVIDISINAAATWLRLSRRTLARRKEQTRLDTLASERVFRMAAVSARAVMTLGSVQRGRTWLMAENQALGGVAPITMLDTDIGARAAEEELIRLYAAIPI
jgi:putative toxin-antitoxin system antitoxin component (TIGR02293 family)